MKKSTILRLISLTLLIIGTIFVACALGNPALGRVFYIGNIKIGVEIWRVFYAIYAIVMCGLFVASFFVGVNGGGMKASILKLLAFIPVLIVVFIMGIVLILEFRWWLVIAFLVGCYIVGHGMFRLFRKIDKKYDGFGS